MRISILIIVHSVLSNVVCAKKDSVPSGKWSYELQISPNLSYRFLSSTEGEKWYAEKRNSTEVPRMGFSVKFMVIRDLSKRWKLGLGLNYNNIGFNTKVTKLTWDTPDDNFPTEIKSSHRYIYEGLSLLGYYKLQKETEKNLELIFGTSLNIFPDKTIVSKTKINGEWTSSSNEGFILNEIYLFGIIGIGKSFELSNKWSLKTSLTFNQAFIPINSISRTKEYLNFLDLNIGINYRFHRKAPSTVQ